MKTLNCLRCDFRHKDNGNCTAVGGFCTAVAAAHCPLLREYLDTGLTPAEVSAPIVRCKDCEYAERYERIDGTAGYYCGYPQNIFTYGERWDRVFKPVKETDDFCSYAVKRE